VVWGQSDGSLTLARKFDVVHKHTVTNNNDIPRVLLAIPPSPSLALHPVARAVGRGKDPIEALKRATLWDRDRLGSACSGEISAGIMGSKGAIIDVFGTMCRGYSVQSPLN
jgi:hypothetical protein